MAKLPHQGSLGAYASVTDGTARHSNRFVHADGLEEVVMYIGIGGLILLIILLMILF